MNPRAEPGPLAVAIGDMGSLRAALKADRPDLDPSPILHEVRAFEDWRGAERSLMEPPTREEIERYLEACSADIGDHYGAAKLHRVQVAAPLLWGMSYATSIAITLRQRERASRSIRASKEEALHGLIMRLPAIWQPGLLARMPSAHGRPRNMWSVGHLESVTRALLRWLRWCEHEGHDFRPSGSAFFAYASDLAREGLATRSAADYLSRIYSGYSAACERGFSSVACDHVISRLTAHAKIEGRRTKTGEQLVGASTIFDLGTDLMEQATATGPRSLLIARDYRNGLLLAIAAAVPQRARTLSFFEMGRTVLLLERPCIHVSLRGSMLKLREHEKRRHGGYDQVLTNPVLWDALDTYTRIFRPLFDDGGSLFPSLLNVGERVSAAHLGRLVGNLTEEHLGVRISVHRVRDNVATEASEELRSGGYMAPSLLNNRSASTTMASYDHAEGVRAARDHGEFLAVRRSFSASLRL